MNINDLMSGFSTPRITDPTAPPRELNIHDADEAIIVSSIEELDRSNLKTEDLYEVFSDWQTKKTLTSKRIFVSTSILVASAAWIGIDHTTLALFGLKISDGSPDRFIIFVLLSIVTSGIFYEFSRRIDASVRSARINHINSDLKNLVKPIDAINEAMKRNGIESFRDLYFDFKSSLYSSRHDAIDVYRAINFYKNNLSSAGMGLKAVTLMEHLIVYSIAFFGIFALASQLMQ